MPRACSLLFVVILGCGLGCSGQSSPDTPQQADEREQPPAPIDVSGYDRSCKSDADCMLVHTQPCAKCGCASDPIAVRERERFSQAIAAVRCPSHDPWPDIDCGACMEPDVHCDAGQCKTKQ
jgi:hypothetical protein